METWMEIFRTGEHTDSAGNTKVWSEADLDNICSTYNPALHEAPVVIGHPENNAPAYGWIKGLKRVGERLLARAGEMVPEFIDAVKNGLYKKRSIALNADGTLRHVGFLGAMPPAVKGLRDVVFSSADHLIAYEFPNNSIDDAIFDSALTAPPEYNELKRELEILKAQLFEEKKKAVVNRFIEKSSSFNSFIYEKSEEGILTPAQAKLANRIAEQLRPVRGAEFAQEGNSSADIILSMLREFISLVPKRNEFSGFPEPKKEHKTSTETVRSIIRTAMGIK